MGLSLGIFLGILAMFCWGIADFFVAKAVRKISVFKTFIWSQFIGLMFFFVIFLLFFKFPMFSLKTTGLVLLTGLLLSLAYLAFYKGLQVGIVSVVSPIAASWAVVTVFLSLIFLNEKLTAIQAIAISLVILGAILTSFKLHDLLRLRLKNPLKGVHYALIALFGWGVSFVFIGSLVSELNWFLPMFFVKSTIIFYLLAYSGITKKNISFPKHAYMFVILIGMLEVVAFSFYGIGITSENTVLVAPIGAAFPIVTIILARIFFKEKLEINQKIGVVSVLTGLVLLSL